MVEGHEPALTAAEQVVQLLYARLVAPRLAPYSDAFVGAEYWVQIYEGGRGLGVHYDKVRAGAEGALHACACRLRNMLHAVAHAAAACRHRRDGSSSHLRVHTLQDEHAMKEERCMCNPILSSVYYATGASSTGSADAGTAAAGSAAAGGSSGGCRQAPTLLVDQWFNHGTGCSEPEHPAWSSLVFPVPNQYCLFAGQQAHGVLEAMLAGGELEGGTPPTRVSFLVNWWATQPQAVVRATPEDVQRAGLAPPRDALALSTVGGGGDLPALRPVPFVTLEAPALQAGDVLPVRREGAGLLGGAWVCHH